MSYTAIKEVLQSAEIGSTVKVNGWVKAFRNNQFVQINDGSCQENIQAVIDFEKFDEKSISEISIGAAIEVHGVLLESQGKGQRVEIVVDSFKVVGLAPSELVQETILQPKKHNLEKLREQAHLRFRTNTFGAVFRIRHHISFAIHNYFHQNGFYYLHSPIITGSDAEGAGEMFHVTNFDLKQIPKNDQGEVDYESDFFGKETNLTVSGQLEAELGALALGKVYTFGPTFRAENSNTSRHLAEFWMIEPEMAFADLNDNQDLAENLMKSVIKHVMENCASELEFLEKREQDAEKQLPQNERNEMSLRERLAFVLDNDFVRITYTEAIDILMQSKPFKKKKFQYPVEWGIDLQSEHERYLVEKHFKKPVILRDYPEKIKAFYMRRNDDGKTVAAMDVLFPGIGEVIGGSQREERLDVLLEKCKEFNIPDEHVWWYIDTRKIGSCKHAGFGLGLERLIMFVSGMTNVRDVIPFPRTPKNAEF